MLVFNYYLKVFRALKLQKAYSQLFFYNINFCSYLCAHCISHTSELHCIDQILIITVKDYIFN